MLIASLAVVVAYAALVVIVNRSATPRSGPLTVAGGSDLAPARDHLTLLTWNLGYAALGADMDFVADGGTRYFPRSRAAVLANLRGIVETLKGVDADVFLFQELARASTLNLGVDVVAGVAPRFEGFGSSFDPEIVSRLLPPPLRIAHGTAIYSRLAVAGAEKRLITMENERLAGLLLREYRMHIARLPIAGTAREWVIVNIHLAAFDEGGVVRRRQLADVIAFAGREFAKGNAVVVGGDWNMELTSGQFPHKTAAKDRFWLHDFPVSDLPAGWVAAFDPSVPSVRTVHKPYVAGENYVSVVDAFIVSPNVEADSVKGIDRAFTNSDHQPVIARLRLR